MKATLLGILVQLFFGAVLAYLLDRRKMALERDLNTQATQLLDRFRSELSRSEMEHRVRFTRLHEKRAQVIATTYYHLDKLHRSVRSMLEVATPGQPVEWDEAVKNYRELADYWYGRSIWLDESTNDAIRPVVDMLIEPLDLVSYTRNPRVEDHKSVVEEARYIADVLVPEARKSMEQALRRVLAGEPVSEPNAG